jgi:hypothetical protein
MADTISDKLTRLNEVKQSIKQSIIDKGVQVADDTPFRNYADKIGEISGGGEPVEKTKFGVGIDNFLGNVDADGNYVAPSEPFELNLVGVKRVITTAFTNRFQNTTITKFIANDLIEVGANSFVGCFTSSNKLIRVEVNNIETISGNYAFQQAFYSCNNLQTATFNKLKTVSGAYCFQNAFNSTPIKSLDNVFPSLEYVSGNYAFSGIISYVANDTITLSNIKKITGSTSQYGAIFGSFYIQNTVWKFPSATEFTGYIWNVSSSYAGEIHFAAANQAAIEACEGYANKWGFAGATIFFDL